MSIRDVNSYIAESESGRVKRKGAYEWNYEWHQDPSATVVPKAVEAFLVYGTPIREFITSHRDPFDFMLRAKVPRSSRLEMRWPALETSIQLQNTTRYYISRSGGVLVKVSPPKHPLGSWKRKQKVTDSTYHAVMRENAGKTGETDSQGVIWDERIHAKKKTKHDIRSTRLCAEETVMECARASDFDWSRLNYEYYITQAQKLVDPLIHLQH